MKIKIIIAVILLTILISAGTLLTFALQDKNAKPVKPEDVISKIPKNMIIEDGDKIIKDKFPEISNSLEYKYSQFNNDKSIEWLQYSSEKANFSVNAKAKTIDMLLMKGLDETKNATIDLAKANDIARSYIQKYRPDFSLSEMKQTTSELHDYGSVNRFRFEWEKYENDVYVGTYVTVELTGGGALKMYSVHINEESAIDINSVKITEEKAVSIAKKYLSNLIEKENFDNLKTDETKKAIGNGLVCWSIAMSSQPETDQPVYHYLIIIDAETGIVLNYMAG